jgi:probable blue pigment (indigoidine) exporter
MACVPASLAMLIAALLWGSAYPVTGFLLADLPPMGAAVWRALLAAIALAIVAARRGETLPGRAATGRLVIMGLLGGAVFIIGMNLGVELTGASLTSFVAGTYPIWAVLMAPLVLGEHLGRQAIAALAIATIGTMLLIRPGGSEVQLAGVAAALGGALAFALYLDVARRWSGAEMPGPTIVALVLMVAVVVVCVPIQLLLDPSGLVPALSLSGGIALLWLALPAGAMAHALVNFAVRRLPAERSAPFLMLVPVSGAVIAALLLGERLDPIQLIGGALIVAGIGLATLQGIRLPLRQVAA